jgi:hypothetical protein
VFIKNCIGVLIFVWSFVLNESEEDMEGVLVGISSFDNCHKIQNAHFASNPLICFYTHATYSQNFTIEWK